LEQGDEEMVGESQKNGSAKKKQMDYSSYFKLEFLFCIKNTGRRERKGEVEVGHREEL